MTWSLVIIGSLTALISLVALGWIWAESKPPTRPKGSSETSHDYASHKGMEKE